MTEQAKVIGDVKVRYDWYQTETDIIINILQKNIDASLLKIECASFSLTINLPGLEEPLIFYLSHSIRSENYTIKVTASKIEIRLPKDDGIRWEKLEGAENLNVKSIPKVSESEPSTSEPVKAKNWDAVVKNEDDDENDPLNELFKKIYAEGSDEVRKAMNKSFMESGGTVLSTNWNEVKTDKVDMKPPDGMEWKKWDS